MQNEADGQAIRVWVISPSPAVRVGLHTLLENTPRLHVTAEMARFPENGAWPSPSVDVVVIAADIEHMALPVDFPCPVLLLVQASLPQGNFPASVRGVLPLDSTSEELVAAVQAVYAGLWTGAAGIVQPPWQRNHSVEWDDGNYEGETLTRREHEVLTALTRGLTNRQIATELVISENTVKYHISSIYAKLGASNRAEAVRLAARRGWLAL